MSRYSSIFDSLADPKGRFRAEKQAIDDLIYDSVFNTLKDQDTFLAKVILIPAQNDGNPSSDADTPQDRLVALKVRLLKIQGLSLPDPCSKACEQAGPGYVSYLIALHPTAYSVPRSEGSPEAISYGDTVECFYENRRNYRRLRWRRKTGSEVGNNVFGCASDTGASALFAAGVPSILDNGEVNVNQFRGTYKGSLVLNGSMEQYMIMTKNALYNRLLLPEAARAFDKMADDYNNTYGKIQAAANNPSKMPINEGYRSLEEQKRKKKAKGPQAATPGQSNHGWGLAVDFSTLDANGVRGFKSDVYAWLTKNADKYDFKQPGWAKEGGSNPEPWHWEYTGPTELIKNG